jgi:uncharacterized membrane protein YqjE
MSNVLPPSPAVKAAAPPPAGELVKNLTAQLSTLVRSEVKLAAAEVKGKVKPLGIGIGLFAGAAFVAVAALQVLLVVAILAIALALPAWLSALIVAVALLVLAGILALVGKKLLSRGLPPVPNQTIDSVKRDVATIKGAARR